MKKEKLSIQDFELFKVERIYSLKGGVGGTVTGSQINNGETLVDVEWDDGSDPTCNGHLASGGNNDGSEDDKIGMRVGSYF